MAVIARVGVDAEDIGIDCPMCAFNGSCYATIDLCLGTIMRRLALLTSI